MSYAGNSMEVETKHLGRIIGKGGSKIKELEEISGAKINVPKDGDRHAAYTDIEICGSEDCQDRAKDLIKELCSRDFSDRDGGGGGRDRGYNRDRDNRGYGGGGGRDRDRGYSSRDRDRSSGGGGYGGGRDRDSGRDRGYGGDRDRGYGGGDRDRRGGGGGGDRTCFNCRKPGHIAARCPDKNE